jgi:MYXO-CTERM domain-containing protein
MKSRLLVVRQAGPSRFNVLRFSIFLGLAMVMVPSLARAQTTFPFTDILFVERGIIGGSEANGFHFCDEYYGHNGRTGGGLFLLKNFQTKPERVDIVAGLTVPNGKTNAGQTLSSGTFLSPDLSFDGKTIVFAWSSGGADKWVIKNRFHVFKVDIDGKNLVQLTDGNFDDMHPAWMPNGRIIFNSTRRGGYGRCHGRPVPSYTLHSMKSDGTDMIRLSYHETNEFHPAIANDGRVVYTRWDYVDRDFNAAHHIWFCNPDGTNPRSWGGNYAPPMDTLGSGPWTDGRYSAKRPFAEYYPRSIPGSTTKYVATAGPHHGEAYGSLIIRDYSKVDDNDGSQVTKLTPEVAFPEAANGPLTYGPAWPLSATQFLTSYNNTIVLLDTSVSPAKRTQYYQTSNSNLRPIYAQPVAARTPPPVIVESTYQGERCYPGAPPATVQVQSVYTTDAYGKLPDGVKIKSLRIVQVLPKTTQLADAPRLGYSSQNVAKMALGTVPVEADGSVFFEAPIGKEILFQLLDDKGMAVQTMRSGTYLHPGENMVCVGCHEDKMTVASTGVTPTASKRPASKMEPELGKVEPISYARVISPILTKKCLPCHQGKTGAPTNAAYSAMEPYSFWFASAGDNRVKGHGGSRSKAGQIGALGSRMGKALLNATHQKAQTDGTYTEADVRTLVQWLDLGSDELGSFDNEAGQRRGDLVWPTLDVDKNDPQGLKYTPEGPCVAGGSVPPPQGGSGGSTASNGTGGTTGKGGNTAYSGTGGTTGKGGNTGVGGTVASGGQTGSASQTTPAGGAGGGGGAVNTGTQSTAASGGQTNSGGSTGAQSAVAGGGTGERSAVASGGQSASGSQTPSTANGGSGNGCSMGTNSGAPSHAWILLVIGLTLFVRGRRRPG